MTSKFWLYTHNFTHTGAPLVLAAIARELAAEGLRDQLRILSWGGLHDQRHSTLQHKLHGDGIECKILQPCQLPPMISPGDRVLLNTVALPENVIHKALSWLRDGRLKRLDWFAHESDPETWIQNAFTRSCIKDALNSGLLNFKVPSMRVCEHYKYWLNFFGDNLSVQCPKVEDGESFYKFNASKVDFSGPLRLALVGAVGSGNKGHLWLIRFLQDVLCQSPNNSKSMRQIELKFLGLEEGIYASLSRFVIEKAQLLLGDKFSWSLSMTREKMLEELAKSNLLVNCSLKEAFSCVSSEAMCLGLPLLRMRNGGFEEQLLPDQQNGFDLGDPSPYILPSQIKLMQSIRDPLITPQSQLDRMSLSARMHGRNFLDIKYSNWLLNK